MTTVELAKRVGVTRTAISVWVTAGVIIPVQRGTGNVADQFNEEALQTGLAIRDAGGLIEYQVQQRGLFTSGQVAKTVGTDVGTINRWVQQEVLEPVGMHGNRHVFDAVAIDRAKEILEAGGLAKWRHQQNDLLTSVDIVGQTSLTYRRLDYWVRVGLITPVVEARGSGTQRLWAPSVVNEINDLLERIALCPFGHPEV